MTTLDLTVNSDAHEDHTGANFSDSASIVNCNAHTSGVANRRYRGGFEFPLTQAIPSGSTIDVAYITVHANSTAADDPNVDIRGEDTADAPDFATNADVTSRTRTTASVQWTTTGIGTGAVNSPSIVSILQELIDDNGGLANGASIAIFLDGRSDAISTFQIMSIEGAGTEAALHIEFTAPSGGVTVTPAVLTAVAAVVAPTIVLGSLVLSGLVCSAVAVTVNPSVILGPIGIAPDPAVAIAGNVNPTVVIGSIAITPNAAVSVANTVNPTVDAGGNISVTPTPVFSVAQTVNPTVILGSLSIAPNVADSVGTTVNPTTVLGSLVLNLGNITAVGLTIDPTVSISTGAIVPSPVTAVGYVVNPTTIQGDLIISGLVCAAVGYTANPTVLDSDIEIIYDTGVIYMPALYGAIYAPDTSGIIYMPVLTGKVKS